MNYHDQSTAAALEAQRVYYAALEAKTAAERALTRLEQLAIDKWRAYESEKKKLPAKDANKF